MASAFAQRELAGVLHVGETLAFGVHGFDAQFGVGAFTGRRFDADDVFSADAVEQGIQ